MDAVTSMSGGLRAPTYRQPCCSSCGSVGSTDDLWRTGYRLNEGMRPTFITRQMACTILRAGKSINFLRSFSVFLTALHVFYHVVVQIACCLMHVHSASPASAGNSSGFLTSPHIAQVSARALQSVRVPCMPCYLLIQCQKRLTCIAERVYLWTCNEEQLGTYWYVEHATSGV